MRDRIRTAAGVGTVTLGSALVAATPALAQSGGGGPDYSVLTDGLKEEATSGIEQALPIVALVLAAIVVVGLIRKFAKAK